VIGIVIAIVVAALVYWLCMAIGLPSIVAIIAAILVLLAGIPTGGYGFGSRWGGGGRWGGGRWGGGRWGAGPRY
jgi:hypothetical protein